MNLEEIEQLLNQALAPTELRLVNESHLHQGHSHDGTSGYSHIAISISSPFFEGLSLIKKHRLVNEAIKPAFAAGLHASKIHIL